MKSKEGASPFDVEFKIADLGVSHFKRHVTSQGEATDRDTYGTRAYGILHFNIPPDIPSTNGTLGAPECYRADDDIDRVRFLVKQNVDIWSLGCVFSEAAVWLVFGKAQLAEYRRRRGEETEQIYGFRDGNCFHDGRQVLTSVTQIHRTLAVEIRKSDHVTEPILKMVTDEMLVESNNRTPARCLRSRTQRILKEAEVRFKDSALNAVSGSVSGSAVQSPPRTPPEPPPGHREPRWSNSYNQRLLSHVYAGSPVDASYNEGEIHHQEHVDGYFGQNALQHSRYSDHSTRPLITDRVDQDQFHKTHLNGTISDVTLSQDSPNRRSWQEPPSPNSRRRRTPSDQFSAINTNGSDISTQNRQETYNASQRNAFTASPGRISRTDTATLMQDPYNGSRVNQHQTRYASGARSGRVVSTGISNVHPSMGAKASPRPPFLSVADAERWKRDKKKHRPVELHLDHLLADLDQRDHVSLRCIRCI